jgi:WD40 repeat protein
MVCYVYGRLILLLFVVVIFYGFKNNFEISFFNFFCFLSLVSFLQIISINRSLKNPMWPQRIYKATSGVTSLDWSTQHPTLIAVGHYDGNISVYDVRRQDPLPVLESSHLAQKHTGAVWQVKWVQKGPAGGSSNSGNKEKDESAAAVFDEKDGEEKAESGTTDEHESTETLISISTDGRIAEWSIKKGLSCSDLMVLKRIPNEYFRGMGNISIGTSSVATKVGGDGGGERGDGIISRQASGMCFDFPNGDGTTYLAGTEDGIVHRCSVSYNEQYLDNYFGHSGPIYRVRFSPFHPQIFVTCSADWTIKLWHLTKQGR